MEFRLIRLHYITKRHTHTLHTISTFTFFMFFSTQAKTPQKEVYQHAKSRLFFVFDFIKMIIERHFKIGKEGGGDYLLELRSTIYWSILPRGPPPYITPQHNAGIISLTDQRYQECIKKKKMMCMNQFSVLYSYEIYQSMYNYEIYQSKLLFLSQ